MPDQPACWQECSRLPTLAKTRARFSNNNLTHRTVQCIILLPPPSRKPRRRSPEGMTKTHAAYRAAGRPHEKSGVTPPPTTATAHTRAIHSQNPLHPPCPPFLRHVVYFRRSTYLSMCTIGKTTSTLSQRLPFVEVSSVTTFEYPGFFSNMKSISS